ncbi:MAG: transcriptional regulator, partial [Xanthobacteraceae bacterium]
TKSGRKRFLDYLAVLEQLVRDAAKAAGKRDAKQDSKHDAKQESTSARLRILPA